MDILKSLPRSFSMNRTGIMEYAELTNREAAANLLLLLGPDGYEGDYEDYNELMYILTNNANQQTTKGE